MLNSVAGYVYNKTLYKNIKKIEIYIKSIITYKPF